MISKWKVVLAVLVALVSWCSIKLALMEYEIPPLDKFVKSHGYPFEEHEVETEDGYIITLHRIPHGKGQEKGHRLPVMLQHGSTGSSYNFLALGPESSLALLLADRGYDVWLGNVRGNKYALKHTSLSVSDSKFWDHSWHEMGLYDLAAEIDYILSHTNHQKLTYIGYSMGTSMIGVLLSSRIEYNEKVEIFIGLAPAFCISEVNSFIMTIFGNYIEPWISKLFGYHNWFPWVDELSEVLWKMCKPQGFFSPICVLMYNDLGTSTQLRKEEMSVIFGTILSSGSIKTGAHLGQIGVYGKFRPFVHGPSEDKERYGTEEPPEYNLEKMTVPMAFIYSDSDSAVSLEGIKRLGQIWPHASFYKVQHSAFNHLDFLFGKDVVQLVYKEVFRILNEIKKTKKGTHV